MRKHGNLKRAWQVIKANGRRSSSPYITDDIERFFASEDTKIRSISAKIQHQTYTFSKARGVAIAKPQKPGSVRPIVIPRAQDRVVQRCILDALLTDPQVKAKAFQPLSFGGVPKRPGEALAGVPAAIKALMNLIDTGGTHVIVADISSFFSNIRKSDAISQISDFTDDKRFMKLFTDAIAIDLDNHDQLWRYKDHFPYGDVGVGQGVCLSPFLGNLVLSAFDEQMNASDCSCIRYVDDIIIVAPSGRAASARFRLAKKLLAEKGMTFAADKTSAAPIPVDQSFEYLGIEFHGQRIRPANKSRISIVRRAQDVAALSIQAIKSAQTSSEFDLDCSIPRTLSKISGMSRGWANHYRFCNDLETIKNVDRKISSVFLNYCEKANQLALNRMKENKPDLASAYLGYLGISRTQFQPFTWSSANSRLK